MVEYCELFKMAFARILDFLGSKSIDTTKNNLLGYKNKK